MHGTTQGVVDLIAVIRVVGVESGLDVPGRSHNCLDRSIKVKDVVEYVVVAIYQPSPYERGR